MYFLSSITKLRNSVILHLPMWKRLSSLFDAITTQGSVDAGTDQLCDKASDNYRDKHADELKTYGLHGSPAWIIGFNSSRTM